MSVKNTIIVNLKKSLKKLFKTHWPVLFGIFLVFIFYWKYFIKGLIPLPADFIVGTYYPWLDYKWGVVAGVPVKNPLVSDVVSVIYPLRMLVVDQIKSGNFPLWNPYMFAGYPLFANFQVAAISPTIIFYLFFEKATAWSLQIIIQPFLAFIFTYLLLRNFKLSKTSSIFGGITYAFSGFAIIYMEWNAHALVAAFIPLVLLLALKLYESRSLKIGAFLSVAVGFQIFSGYPQLVLYTLIAAIPFVVLIQSNKVVYKNLFLIYLFIILGILLSSIQTIPTLELFFNSQRNLEVLSLEDAFLPVQNLVTFLAPDYFGNHATYNYWGKGNYGLSAGYSGIVALMLAILGLRFGKNRKLVRFFALTSIVTLIVALKNPISTFLLEHNFHGGRAASATRIFVLTNLSIAILSAQGLDILKKVKNAHKYTAPFLLILILLFIFSYGKNFDVALRNLVLPTLIATTVMTLLVIQKNFPNLTNLISFSFILLITFELFRYGWKFTPMSPRQYIFPDTKITDFLQNNKLDRIHFSDVIPMNMWVPYKLSSLGSYDAVYPEIVAKFIAVNNSSISTSNIMGRHASLDRSDGKLVDIAGVNRILSLSNEFEKYDPDTSRIFNDGSVYVYKNNSAIPRVKIYDDWLVEEDDIKILEKLLSNNFDPNETIIINTSLSRNIDNEKELISYSKIVRYSANEIEIDYDSNKDGLLYLSDTYYPGWEVRIDGYKTKILKANYMFRAIPIKKGEHKVEFIYNPLSFRIGAWLSGAVFTLIVGLFIYDNKIKIRRRAS